MRERGPQWPIPPAMPHRTFCADSRLSKSFHRSCTQEETAGAAGCHHHQCMHAGGSALCLRCRRTSASQHRAGTYNWLQEKRNLPPAVSAPTSAFCSFFSVPLLILNRENPAGLSNSSNMMPPLSLTRARVLLQVAPGCEQLA